jgi:hypothetical protein
VSAASFVDVWLPAVCCLNRHLLVVLEKMRKGLG